MCVIIKIMGGLASQMHKYAIGRTIADNCNSELMLDLSWFRGAVDTDTQREFQLDKFNTRYTIGNKNAIGQLKSTDFRLKMSSVAKKFGIKRHFLKNTHYAKIFDKRDVLSLTSPIYIEGEWFGGAYIDSSREDLIRDFSLKKELGQNSLKLFKKIISIESVAIHVRRGDYVTNPSAASFHYLTGIAYYKAAVEHCLSVLNNPVFFVFSDDATWASNAFSSLSGRFVYVSNNEPFEDMELIKTCKHQIICNSGFSWFGAWLNNYEGKINIAPKNWVRDVEFNEHIIKELLKSKMIIL